MQEAPAGQPAQKEKPLPCSCAQRTAHLQLAACCRHCACFPVLLHITGHFVAVGTQHRARFSAPSPWPTCDRCHASGATDPPGLLQAATSGQATTLTQNGPAPTGLWAHTMGLTAQQDVQPKSAKASVKTHRVQAEAPSQAPATASKPCRGTCKEAGAVYRTPQGTPGEDSSTTVEPQGAQRTGRKEHQQLGVNANKRSTPSQAPPTHAAQQQNWSEEASEASFSVNMCCHHASRDTTQKVPSNRTEKAARCVPRQHILSLAIAAAPPPPQCQHTRMRQQTHTRNGGARDAQVGKSRTRHCRHVQPTR